MMLLNIFLIAVYTFIAGLALVSLWPLKRVNPVFWFIIFQWIIATGTFVVADLSSEADVLYCSLFFMAFIAFYSGAKVTLISLSVKGKYHTFFNSPVEEDRPITRYLIAAVTLLSAAICLIYYQKIGYNLFYDVLTGKEIEDFKSARLATYSGETYYAPGYVNQFKNVLLPVGLSVISLWLWFYKRRFLFIAFTGFSVALSLYVLLGTGQRAPFVYSFVAFLFGLASIARFRLFWLITVSILLVALFGLFSVLNERAEGLDPLTIIESFLTRIFVNDQQEGLWGFRHVLGMGVAWFSDWGLGVLGILPGHSGSPLAHELYYQLHGTARGTSGLSTVGSVFHNGGIIAVPLFYFFLGFLYATIFYRFISGRRTVLRGMSYGGMFFILSVFVAGGPIVLINKGLIAFLLLIIARKIRIGGTPLAKFVKPFKVNSV